MSAAITDQSADFFGHDGQYYFGTVYKDRAFNISFAFDSLEESKLQLLKKVFQGEDVYELVFDETPYKAWDAKVNGSSKITYICFYENGKRVYKGEGSISFICYSPYAHTPSKLWKLNGTTWSYVTEDARDRSKYDSNAYPDKTEWLTNSVLPESFSSLGTAFAGDLPTSFTYKLTSTATNPTQSYSIYGLQVSISGNNSRDVTINFKNAINYQTGDELVWDSGLGIVSLKHAEVWSAIATIQTSKVLVNPGEAISIIGYLLEMGETFNGSTETLHYKYRYL